MPDKDRKKGVGGWDKILFKYNKTGQYQSVYGKEVQNKKQHYTATATTKTI